MASASAPSVLPGLADSQGIDSWIVTGSCTFHRFRFFSSPGTTTVLAEEFLGIFLEGTLRSLRAKSPPHRLVNGEICGIFPNPSSQGMFMGFSEPVLLEKNSPSESWRDMQVLLEKAGSTVGSPIFAVMTWFNHHWLVVTGCHEFGIFPLILGLCHHPN